MSYKGECFSCSHSWIFDDMPDPSKTIKQCKDCHDKGYPSRLIYSMAVMPGELDIYDQKEWELKRRESCR